MTGPAVHAFGYLNRVALVPFLLVIGALAGYDGSRSDGMGGPLLALCAACLVLSIRTLRTGLWCRTAGGVVVVRGYFWSRRVRVDDIDRVATAESSMPLSLGMDRTVCPVIVLVSGQRLKIRGLLSFERRCSAAAAAAQACITAAVVPVPRRAG